MNINTNTAHTTAAALVARFGSVTAATAHLIVFAAEFDNYAIREIFSANMGGTNDAAVRAVRTELDCMI
jgi:hypothetical protein